MARPSDFAVSDDPRVQAQLDRLGGLSVPQGRLGIDTIRELLGHLGDPHHRLPPVFHVAGTNGKGSTCAFLRAGLEAAGHSVHVFTSPHLVRFNERIRVAGALITDDMLADLLGEVLDVTERHRIGASFFEVSTAAAFLAFTRTPADACVVEVGLGGRFDATNVIEHPVSCGIASLGIDHEAFLLSPDESAPAEPLPRIAFEKAGITKTGAPLVTMDYPATMNAVIAGKAASTGSALIRQGETWSVEELADGFLYRDDIGTLVLPAPRLPGSHQIANAGLAVAMLRHQQAVPVVESALVEAMDRASWPARLQRLKDGPLTALLSPGTPFWLDGGHNPDAGQALARHFARMPGKIDLVIGMLANKSPAALLQPLAGKLASITVVPVPGHDCHGAAAYTEFAAGIPIRAAGDVNEALSELPSRIDQVVLIAGSLYLAGIVLRENEEIPD